MVKIGAGHDLAEMEMESIKADANIKECVKTLAKHGLGSHGVDEDDSPAWVTMDLGGCASLRSLDLLQGQPQINLVAWDNWDQLKTELVKSSVAWGDAVSQLHSNMNQLIAAQAQHSGPVLGWW